MEEPYIFGGTGGSPGKPHEKGRRRKSDPQDVHKKFIISSVSSAEILPACNFDVNKLFDHNTFPFFIITNLMILD